MKPSRERLPGSERAAHPEAGQDGIDARVGQEVRDLRKALGMTLMQLADATSLSVGYLSQLERGLSNPSVSALYTISRALGVTIGWFLPAEPYRDDDVQSFVVRANEQRMVRYANGVIDELLAPTPGRQLDLRRSTLPPGTSGGDTPCAHEGEESGLVIQGRLHLWLGPSRVELKVGDSFAFPSTIPHRYRNDSDETTVVVWATTPPTE